MKEKGFLSRGGERVDSCLELTPQTRKECAWMGGTGAGPEKWPRKERAVVAKMCRKAPSAFKSLFGTRRSKKSQPCGQGPKTQGDVSSENQMTRVCVTTSASGREHLMERMEEGRGTKGVGQVVRVPVTK